MEKIIAKKKTVFAMKKVHINTLKLQLLDPELHKLGIICTLSHENPSCGPRERLRQAVFLENAMTEYKMSLRTSALAYFIQNKLYF